MFQEDNLSVRQRWAKLGYMREYIARLRAIKYTYRWTGERGTVGKKDVNRVGNGFVVGGMDIPRMYTV